MTTTLLLLLTGVQAYTQISIQQTWVENRPNPNGITTQHGTNFRALEEPMVRAGVIDHLPRVHELMYLFGIFRATRVTADIGMQLNEMTIAEAADHMMEGSPWVYADVARVDAEIYLREPGYGISYQMGKIQIDQLLADRAMQLGDRFSLKDFHDRFLAAGVRIVAIDVDSPQLGSPGYLLRVCLVATLGGLLFGYDTAVISGTVTKVVAQFGLDSLQTGWFVGSALIGSIAGVSSGGMISDKIGRKRSMILSALLSSVALGL